MSEFIYNLMHPLPNAVMTVIMGIIVLYWLFVLLSGAGLDDLDLGFHFDVDIPEPDIADIEPDISPEAGSGSDIDNEADVSSESQMSTFMKVLNFINVGKVPFMLVLSTLKFFTWVGTLITTHFINVNSWGTWSLLILIPLFCIALFFTKWTTTPMVKLFKEVGYKGEEPIDFLGRTGKMLSTIQENKIGCAEVLVDKNPMKLNVKSIDGKLIKYGDYIIVADESDDKKTYLVSKEESLRNIN